MDKQITFIAYGDFFLITKVFNLNSFKYLFRDGRTFVERPTGEMDFSN